MNPIKSPSQLMRQKRELVKELQGQMCSHFLGHKMYDINDALTSILALCDMERVKSIPKIKHYIQRVNKLMDDVQLYQNMNCFNINHVLLNVINIIRDNFREKAIISSSISSVKAMVQSSQYELEQILLFILVEFISTKDPQHNSEIFIELSQKDRDAHILIRKQPYIFSTKALQELEDMRTHLDGTVQISPKDKGVEISIRLPLSFSKILPAAASASTGAPAGKTSGKTTAVSTPA